jgi:putative hemolysin
MRSPVGEEYTAPRPVATAVTESAHVSEAAQRPRTGPGPHMIAVGLVTVVLLVVANGFFVAAEFAMVAARRSRLEQLAAEGDSRAVNAREVLRHLDAYIAACQLGITMASLGLGWAGEPALARLIEPPLMSLLGERGQAAAHGAAVAIAFSLITALHIVVGELAPKGIALQKPEATTLAVARPLRLFYAIFRMPTTLLNWVGNSMLRLVGFQPASGHEMVHSVEELRLLVAASHEAGTVEESEARIATRAFSFADLTAGELMTPRPQIHAVPVDAAQDQLLAAFQTSQRTRLPVYEDTLDHVLGVVYVHDFLGVACAPTAGFRLREVIKPIRAVPAAKPADELLEDMRSARDYIALVVDEFGSTVGLITLHDLVEGLVGRVEDHTSPASIGPLEPDGSRILDALTPLHEFEEAAGLRLSEDERATADTVSGLVMAKLGRVPRTGDEVAVGARRLRVEKLRGRRADRVRLLPEGQAAAPRPADPGRPSGGGV